MFHRDIQTPRIELEGCFLNMFHDKICNGCANGRANGATKNLLIMMFLVGEKAVTENELQKFHYVSYGNISAVR